MGAGSMSLLPIYREKLLVITLNYHEFTLFYPVWRFTYWDFGDW